MRLVPNKGLSGINIDERERVDHAGPLGITDEHDRLDGKGLVNGFRVWREREGPERDDALV